MTDKKEEIEIDENIKRELYGVIYKDNATIYESLTELKIFLKSFVVVHDKIKGTTAILPRILIKKE